MTPDTEPRVVADLDGSWRKSSYSSGQCTCVQVRLQGAMIQIRDSKADLDPGWCAATPPIIEVTLAEWDRLCRRIAAGRPVLAAGSLSIELRVNGTAQFRCSRTGVALSYGADEITAFFAGIRAGELCPGRLAA